MLLIRCGLTVGLADFKILINNNEYRMNRAFLIGVNHNDPFARKNTIYIMNNLKNMGVIPDFIAVEWSKENADKLISSRPLMTKKVQETFPLFSDILYRSIYPCTNLAQVNEHRQTSLLLLEIRTYVRFKSLLLREKREPKGSLFSRRKRI